MSTKYKTISQELPAKLGEVFAEHFKKSGQEQIVTEKYGITFKESGQTTSNNSSVYVDLLAGTIYEAAISKIEKILDLVEINDDLKSMNGAGALKLPRDVPTIAYEVQEGVVTNYFNEGTSDIVITCSKVAVGTSITWELLKRGMSDFAKHTLKKAADAIHRKLASDIVNGLAAGSSHTPVSSSGLTFGNVLSAETNVNTAQYDSGVSFGFIADAVVIASSSWGTFRQDSDVKNSMYYASAIPGEPVNAARMPLMVGNLEVIVTPFLTTARAIVLERKRNILVRESDLEVWEGEIPGRRWDRELLAMMSYALAMLYPASVAAVAA